MLQSYRPCAGSSVICRPFGNGDLPISNHRPTHSKRSCRDPKHRSTERIFLGTVICRCRRVWDGVQVTESHRLYLTLVHRLDTNLDSVLAGHQDGSVISGSAPRITYSCVLQRQDEPVIRAAGKANDAATLLHGDAPCSRRGRALGTLTFSSPPETPIPD